MRYLVFIFSVLFIFSSCKKNDGSIIPSEDQELSSSSGSNGIMYTFAIPKDTLGVKDTLSATVTAFNQSAVPETLVISGVRGFFSWSLKNTSGKTIMYGPTIFNNLIAKTLFAAKGSAVIGGIHQKIIDTSGAVVVPGSYILQSSLYNGSITFSLNIFLQ